MKYYTNKNTQDVYAYDTDAIAKEYNKDYPSLVNITDAEYDIYINHRPSGGVWNIRKWDIDPELKAKEEKELEDLENKESLEDVASVVKEMSNTRVYFYDRKPLASNGGRTGEAIFKFSKTQLKRTILFQDLSPILIWGNANARVGRCVIRFIHNGETLREVINDGVPPGDTVGYSREAKVDKLYQALDLEPNIDHEIKVTISISGEGYFTLGNNLPASTFEIYDNVEMIKYEVL